MRIRRVRAAMAAATAIGEDRTERAAEK